MVLKKDKAVQPKAPTTSEKLKTQQTLPIQASAFKGFKDGQDLDEHQQAPAELLETKPGSQLSAEYLAIRSSRTKTIDDTTVITKVPKELREDKLRRDRLYLLVIAGALTGQMFQIERSNVVVGRSSGCDISLRDNDISRQHAQISVLPGSQIILTDLKSSNGTFVNGKRVSQSEIKDGDRIQLGLSTILKFSLHDELEEKLQKRLYENAILDGLTQLHNRKFFDDQLDTEFSFAKRHKTALSILLMDIDHFKNLNDTYGHLLGDEVLIGVAEALKETIRKEDIVARYGGEEFVVVARGILPTQAAILGERIRSKIESLAFYDENKEVIKVSMSVGIATMHTQQFDSPEAFLQEVDDRLYTAKRNGRNQVVADSW